ncbi:MAG: helix-turn-helix domain-containing protein [Lachnospiraceae bacterium]|nr:helix-turn-helix domain-containing protein [Lachnospiraceae bacterium]
MKARNELNYCLFIQKTNNIQRQPLNTELDQYSSICNGDVETVKQYLEESGNLFLRHLSEHPLRNAQYHLAITASDISKACIQGGMGHDEAYTLADIYIRKADKCENHEDITQLFQELHLDFTVRMQEIRKQSVISLHIRKCIDYIYENLGQKLTVNELAAYCDLHPSYLSELFYSETGKHLKQFVLEAKIDTAQNLLKYSDLTYLDISVSLGFSSQSAFISTFRKISGMTPKRYRDKYYVSK